MGYIFIHSATLCLLIRTFNPFTVMVITDRYLLISIFPFCSCIRLSHSFPFSLYSSPISISCSAGLVEEYSSSLLFSGKLLVSPSILIESLTQQNSLDCRPLLFITWNISCHSLLVCSVSVKKSAASLFGTHLCVNSYFSLAAFKILSLPINLGILIMMCLGVCFLGFILIGNLSTS